MPRLKGKARTSRATESRHPQQSPAAAAEARLPIGASDEPERERAEQLAMLTRAAQREIAAQGVAAAAGTNVAHGQKARGVPAGLGACALGFLTSFARSRTWL